MFWNLLKYEFKNVNKWYLGLYGIVLFLSVSIGLWLRHFANGRNFFDRLQSSTNEAGSMTSTFFGFTMLIFSGLLVALAISTLFLIIRRFKNSVYEREGYLTLTLPVNEHQIILSKLLGAVIWTILSTLALFLSFGIQFALIIAANLYVSAFPSLSTSLGSVSGVITSLLLGLIYYTGTYYILKNKVNLQ